MQPRSDIAVIRADNHWGPWPVYWSAIWVGVLTTLAIALVVGLAAIALGAHQTSPGGRVLTWKEVGIASLVFGILGTFFSFVVGAWVAGRIADLRRAEPAILHGAIVWLLTIPILVALAGLGAGSFFGNWYGGLAGTPVWVAPNVVAPDPQAAVAARNAALGAVTALLVGLIGSVLGGWMASGEPMSLTHHRTRDLHSVERHAA
jgi:hypothetical protein